MPRAASRVPAAPPLLLPFPFWARQDQGRHFAAHDKPKGLHRSPASRSPGPTMIITLLSRRRRRMQYTVPTLVCDPSLPLSRAALVALPPSPGLTRHVVF